MPLAAVVAYAVFGASFVSHSVGALVAVLVPATAVLVAVLVLRRPRATPREASTAATCRGWSGCWRSESGSWPPLLGGDLTISLLMDPVLVIYPLRVAGWVLWLWAGWLLVRPGPPMSVVFGVGFVLLGV